AIRATTSDGQRRELWHHIWHHAATDAGCRNCNRCPPFDILKVTVGPYCGRVLQGLGESMDPKSHWDEVYRNTAPNRVSWFQPHGLRSLELIRRVCPPPGGPLIDVGGGASTLVDDLLDAGYQDIPVLDISAAALAGDRDRLGGRASLIKWLEADVL